jgi:hypothetical protein
MTTEGAIVFGLDAGNSEATGVIGLSGNSRMLTIPAEFARASCATSSASAAAQVRKGVWHRASMCWRSMAGHSSWAAWRWSKVPKPVALAAM